MHSSNNNCAGTIHKAKFQSCRCSTARHRDVKSQLIRQPQACDQPGPHTRARPVECAARRTGITVRMMMTQIPPEIRLSPYTAHHSARFFAVDTLPGKTSPIVRHRQQLLFITKRQCCQVGNTGLGPQIFRSLRCNRQRIGALQAAVRQNSFRRATRSRVVASFIQFPRTQPPTQRRDRASPFRVMPGPLVSASTRIVRTFQIQNSRPHCPTRCCRNNTPAAIERFHQQRDQHNTGHTARAIQSSRK